MKEKKTFMDSSFHKSHYQGMCCTFLYVVTSVQFVVVVEIILWKGTYFD